MQISITGLTELGVVHNHIAQIYQKLNGNLTPLMQDIGTALSANAQERFLNKQSPDGSYWANLLPSTQQQKGNNNILVQGGQLRQITYNAYANYVEVGTEQDYGKYHQFGAANMVARPFLGISDDDKDDIFEIINKHIMGE